MYTDFIPLSPSVALIYFISLLISSPLLIFLMLHIKTNYSRKVFINTFFGTIIMMLMSVVLLGKDTVFTQLYFTFVVFNTVMLLLVYYMFNLGEGKSCSVIDK